MEAVRQLDPIVSQFDTQQQADDYHQWLAQKVERGLKTAKWLDQEEVAAKARQRREELLAGLRRED